MLKFLILLLLSFNLYAQESIMIERGIYVTHLDSGDYNEDNNILAVELNVDNLYFNISAFDNSFYDHSVSFGSGYKFYSVSGFNFDLLYGVVTGYKDHLLTPCLGMLCAYIVPRISYDMNLTERVAISQSVKLFGTAVVFGVGLKYKF